MSGSLALTSLAAVLALGGSTAAKPCSGSAGVSLEELLPRVRSALALPGTDQVAIDPAGRCIGVQVRTRGTARLVKLLLRGIDVPLAAVELRVVEVKPTHGV